MFSYYFDLMNKPYYQLSGMERLFVDNFFVILLIIVIVVFVVTASVFDKIHRLIIKLKNKNKGGGNMSDESKDVSIWSENGLVSQWVSSSPFVDTVECKHCAWQVPTVEFVSKFCPDCGYLMQNYHELAERMEGF